MGTVFDKAKENAASLTADFTYSKIFEQPATIAAHNACGLLQYYALLIKDMIDDYGATSVVVGASPTAIDRFQFRFEIHKETQDAEYVSVMRFWNDLNALRDAGDDTILVMPDEHNLPLISCDANRLHEILRRNVDNHGMTKYYKDRFDRIDACLQRLEMGNRPAVRLN